MISVYDGHQAGVGRVATDSTWHHWFDDNIATLQAADNDDWKKISRYFINLAVWLNPPGFSTQCLYLSALASHFEYPGFEEYYPERPVRELGAELRLHLSRIYGPCWVSERVWWDIVLYKKLLPFEILREPKPRFDFGGIPPEVIEDTVLGHFVEATMKPALAVKAAAGRGRGNAGPAAPALQIRAARRLVPPGPGQEARWRRERALAAFRGGREVRRVAQALIRIAGTRCCARRR